MQFDHLPPLTACGTYEKLIDRHKPQHSHTARLLGTIQ